MINFFTLLEVGATDAVDAAATNTSGGLMNVLFLYGIIFLFFWLLLIRPQRKKQKEVLRMQNEVKVGDPVLTTGGLYGTVVDTVNDVLIIEFGMNKSVRVPVQRSCVASVDAPDLTISKEEPAKEEKETKENKEAKEPKKNKK